MMLIIINVHFQAARQQSAGPKWFNLPATEITPEIEQDLKLLKLRNVLDRKRHYKKNDSKALPKYFQVSLEKHLRVRTGPGKPGKSWNFVF